MTKRKAEDIDWENEPCPLCSAETLPKEDRIQWIACEACRQWVHANCSNLNPQCLVTYYCESCTQAGRGTTQIREERPKRARIGIDYTALDAGEHINSLRHSYTNLIEERSFAQSTAVSLNGAELTRDYLDREGFSQPILVHDQHGLDMFIPPDLTVDRVAELVGSETPIEVMDVPTQGEDRGWDLGRWAAYYNEPSPSRVRNVISLEVSDSPLGSMIQRPRIVRELDIVSSYWPKPDIMAGKVPKVQAYCLMSLQNSYTDFHIDFAGTSVYYHILQGSKTFLFIPPTTANLNKYSDWCRSPDQSKIFLADQCKDTFKVELTRGDTMFIPSGWIHAVHTPTKSLVVGGNFLHLYGMEKHLMVAHIEEVTKVPGKFRFPHFDKTLWYTAAGVLVQRPVLSPQCLMGVAKMSAYLCEKALAMGNRTSKKLADEFPRDCILTSPLLLAKTLVNYVKLRSRQSGMALPPMGENAEVTTEEYEMGGNLVNVFIPRELWHSLKSNTNTVPQSSSLKEEEEYIETRLTIPTSLTEQIRLYQHHDKTETEPVVEEALATDPEKTPPEQATPVPSKTSYHNENNYIPPIMSVASSQDFPPQLRTMPSTASSENSKLSTTCFRCKTRKRRCDKDRPCQSCIEVGLESSCTDAGFYSALPGASPTSIETPGDIMTAQHQATTHATALPMPALMATPVPKKPRRPGTRCTRCARDKKQCSREEPICDRCVKKGLEASECVYTKYTSAPPIEGIPMKEMLTGTSNSPEMISEKLDRVANDGGAAVEPSVGARAVEGPADDDDGAGGKTPAEVPHAHDMDGEVASIASHVHQGHLDE